MEPAVVVVDVVAAPELRPEHLPAPACGRFSTGMERLPRVGSFADGCEQITGR